MMFLFETKHLPSLEPVACQEEKEEISLDVLF